MIGIESNNRFLGKTNPTMTAAVADGGVINDRAYIQACARQIVDMGHWGYLKVWVDSGLAKLRNSGGVNYVSKAYDISGTGNHAAQATKAAQPSLDGNFFSFAGTDDTLDCGAGSKGSDTGTFTFMAWVDRTTDANVLVRGGATDSNWNVRLSYSDTVTKPYVSVVTTNPSVAEIQAVSLVDYSGKIHIAGVWEPGTSLKLYVNGELLTTTATATTSLRTSTAGWILSRITTTIFVITKSADLRVYEGVAATAIQIAAIYNATKSRYGL